MLTEHDACIQNTSNGWILCRCIYKQDLTCVAFMASHLICGQTNYYLSTLEAFVNQFIDDL